MSRIRMSARLYGGLLLVLPRDLRCAYGDDMTRVFLHRLDAVRGMRRWTVWARALIDLGRHGVRERTSWASLRSRHHAHADGGFSPRQESRRVRSMMGWLEAVGRDARYSLRVLAKDPVFTTVVVLTLALGIGANTALFSVVHGVLLRPLPYPEPGRLVFLQEEAENGGSLTVSYPNFADWREQSSTVSEMVAGYAPWSATLYGLDDTMAVRVMGVSRGFFRTFGVEMFLGRPIRDEENAIDGAAAAVVSYDFWMSRLGAPEDISELTLDLGWNEELPVVGVTPEGFRFLGDVDIWIPLERGPTLIRNAHNHWVVGRLAEGIAMEVAHQELDAIAAAIKQQYPDESQAVGVHVTPLHERLVGEARRPLWILMTAATLVLLVACTNVASTLLARVAARRAELAVRGALGAGRGRLVSQLLTEGALLAVAGALAGLVLAAVTLRTLRVVAAGKVQRLDEVGLDTRVLLFCLVSAALAALLFSLAPALRATRRDASVQAGACSSRAVARGEVWRGLVAIEVALSVILLVGSGLLIRSLANILTADTGFERSGVLTMEFQLPRARYDDDGRGAFLRRLGEQLAAQPGVESFGLVNALPLAPGFKTGPVVVPPYADPEAPDEWDAFVRWRVADAGYFETMGIGVVAGRLFDGTDVAGAPGVAIVNRPLAERLWPGEQAVGKRVRALWDFRGEDLTVVGVVEEARHWNMEPGAQLEIYAAWAQRPEHADAMVAVVRARPASAALIPALSRVLRDVDPDVLGQVATLDDRLFDTLADRNFNLVVLGGFAAVAMLLSLAGIYGVVSYTVARRTREIGIRLALGARPHAVRAMVQRSTLLPAALGAALGCTAAAAAGRLLSGMLYGVEPVDALTLAVAPGFLLAVALVASWVPARRTTRVDPVRALRAE